MTNGDGHLHALPPPSPAAARRPLPAGDLCVTVPDGRSSSHPPARYACEGHPHTPGSGASPLCTPHSRDYASRPYELCKGLREGEASSAVPALRRPLRTVPDGRSSSHPPARYACGGHPHVPGSGASPLCTPHSRGYASRPYELCKGFLRGTSLMLALRPTPQATKIGSVGWLHHLCGALLSKQATTDTTLHPLPCVRWSRTWMPAFAGMTERARLDRLFSKRRWFSTLARCGGGCGAVGPRRCA